MTVLTSCLWATRPSSLSRRTNAIAHLRNLATVPSTNTVTSSFPYDQHFQGLVDQKKSDQSYRYFRNINRLAREFPYAVTPDGNTKIDVWCSNDVLGMGGHPAVIKKMHAVLDQHGACSGGSRNIAGHNQHAVALEEALAHLHSKQAALYFNSGYLANLGALTVLGSHLPGCVILSDELNHASLIDGIRNSKADKVIWRHNDVQDLEAKLAALPRHVPKIIAFESVYSMCGTIAPVAEICDLAERYGAITFVDEVHALGLYGPRGAGIAEHLDATLQLTGQPRGSILDRVHIVSGGLGKGIGGMGGYIAGPTALVDVVRSFARGFIFTTSQPPSVMAGAKKSIEVLSQTPNTRRQLHHNVISVKRLLREHGLPVLPNQSHIVPLMIGDAEKSRQVADILFNEYRIYAQPINAPSVAIGAERLRIAPTSSHTPAQQKHLLQALKEIWGRLGLRTLQEWERDSEGRLKPEWNPEQSQPLWTETTLEAEPLNAALLPSVERTLEDTRVGV
ncbi:5-aminolevulinic acid synthase [Cladobotryum mycophilum]|uniref:5-aminolevulinate synthase n=1 Tax=Cladobotryum mycophilum TaxID=491253 RepID=A0ABR0T105_9HYPO